MASVHRLVFSVSCWRKPRRVSKSWEPNSPLLPHELQKLGLELPRTQAAVLEALRALDLDVHTGDDVSSVVADLRGGRSPWFAAGKHPVRFDLGENIRCDVLAAALPVP